MVIIYWQLLVGHLRVLLREQGSSRRRQYGLYGWESTFVGVVGRRKGSGLSVKGGGDVRTCCLYTRSCGSDSDGAIWKLGPWVKWIDTWRLSPELRLERIVVVDTYRGRLLLGRLANQFGHPGILQQLETEDRIGGTWSGTGHSRFCLPDWRGKQKLRLLLQGHNGTIPGLCYRRMPVFAIACRGRGRFCQDMHVNFWSRPDETPKPVSQPTNSLNILRLFGIAG